MADDRDALIATLTEEGWEQADASDVASIAKFVMHRTAELYAMVDGSVKLVAWGKALTYRVPFPRTAPNSVVLAAARAAVEADDA